MNLLKAYYSALKPERTYANVMTTAAGFLFACAWHIHWALFLFTLLGTTLVVMSACAANNCTDRRIDAKMPRTKARPTATGEVPIRKLAIVATVLGVAGFSILLVHVNVLTALLGAIAYVDYVVLYGWSKRTTPWSTLIGTISGAVPLMAGYTAVTGRFDATVVFLGLVMIFWQMVHFYAIAIFRRKDYAAGNLPVWSVRYGVRNTQKWMLAYTVLYLIVLRGLGIEGNMGAVFFWLTIIAGLQWLYLGVRGLKNVKPEKWARGMFGFSLINLLLLSALIALSPLLP
jgi:protoheme IX farnesyltransferase